MSQAEFQSFLERHQLPASYLDQAFRHFQPVIDDCRQRLTRSSPIVLGINGCQGSGKSTLAAFLQQVFEHRYALKVVNISLDDFYLSKAARANKARDIHPLLATRGVPGTHDTQLALQTMQQLLAGKAVAISRFNKASDDLFPQDAWDESPEQVDIIILEGWCLGARPVPDAQLFPAINPLEAEHDPDGIWRRYVNAQLQTDYRKLFALIDCLVMLKAPSFDSVFSWRLEQENKLAKKLQKKLQKDQKHSETSGSSGHNNSGIMSKQEIEHFIQFFERLTRQMLEEMPERADHCYFLDAQRQIIHEQHRASYSNTEDPDIH